MKKDPTKGIRSDDDDETIREKLLADLDGEAREKMARTVENPAYIAAVRAAAKRDVDPSHYQVFVSQQLDAPLVNEAVLRARDELLDKNTLDRKKLERAFADPALADALAQQRGTSHAVEARTRHPSLVTTVVRATVDVARHRATGFVFGVLVTGLVALGFILLLSPGATVDSPAPRRETGARTTPTPTSTSMSTSTAKRVLPIAPSDVSSSSTSIPIPPSASAAPVRAPRPATTREKQPPEFFE